MHRSLIQARDTIHRRIQRFVCFMIGHTDSGYCSRCHARYWKGEYYSAPSKRDTLVVPLRCRLHLHSMPDVGCSCRQCNHVVQRRHEWDGCICRHCRWIRENASVSMHDWDGCVCRKCGVIREVSDALHDWDLCVCRKCRKGRYTEVLDANKHEWFVSPGYWREGVRTPETLAFLRESKPPPPSISCKRCGIDMIVVMPLIKPNTMDEAYEIIKMLRAKQNCSCENLRDEN